MTFLCSALGMQILGLLADALIEIQEQVLGGDNEVKWLISIEI